MKIEILKGFEKVHSKLVPMKDGTKREMFHQEAYMHQGGAFPVLFNVSLENPTDAYPVGEYKLCPTSFKVNNYNSIELDKYNVSLLSVGALNSVKTA